ncbi:hypothetical protein [Pseudomonas viridiflava]|uniref:hypothetical protein n=1 Tax=Pseudomonas viridiflava TaxID=33069 RepID=UPI0020BECC1B|nr:hypothetical protein [Pseudomonas viridiflava]
MGGPQLIKMAEIARIEKVAKIEALPDRPVSKLPYDNGSKAKTPESSHDSAGTTLGSPGNKSIVDSDPALLDVLQAALDSEKAKIPGVTVKVGVPAPR